MGILQMHHCFVLTLILSSTPAQNAGDFLSWMHMYKSWCWAVSANTAPCCFKKVAKCLFGANVPHAAKNEMQMGGLAHCWWESSKPGSPSCDVKTLRWNPPKQEQLSEGVPAPGRIKALKMGLPIDRNLCISILLSPLMPFQCQQTQSSKRRRGVGSLCCSLTGTAGPGFAGGNHPTTEMGPTDLLADSEAGRWIPADLLGWLEMLSHPHFPFSLSSPCPLLPGTALLSASTTSTPGETQQLHGEGQRVLSPTLQGWASDSLCHRSRNIPPGSRQGENGAVTALKALADLTCWALTRKILLFGSPWRRWWCGKWGKYHELSSMCNWGIFPWKCDAFNHLPWLSQKIINTSSSSQNQPLLLFLRLFFTKAMLLLHQARH